MLYVGAGTDVSMVSIFPDTTRFIFIDTLPRSEFDSYTTEILLKNGIVSPNYLKNVLNMDLLFLIHKCIQIVMTQYVMICPIIIQVFLRFIHPLVEQLNTIFLPICPSLSLGNGNNCAIHYMRSIVFMYVAIFQIVLFYPIYQPLFYIILHMYQLMILLR